MDPLEWLCWTEASSVEFVFAGVARLPKATQTCRSGVTWIGIESPTVARWWRVYFRGGLWGLHGMAFCAQYSRKWLLILRRECAWHTSIWTNPALHNMPKMSKFEVTACFVWACLKETLRKTAAMRQEEQGKYNQWRWTRLVYVLLLFTNRRGYLPLGVLLSTQSNWVRPGNKTCKLSVLLLTCEGVWILACLTAVVLR